MTTHALKSVETKKFSAHQRKTQNKAPSIKELVSNRDVFNSFVYTPLKTAVNELKNRQLDKSIPEPVYIPKKLKNNIRAILSVCLVTPNQEIKEFIDLCEILKIEPIIFERIEDKYVPQNNSWKHSLGKMRFVLGKSKNNKNIYINKNVIDFNQESGKKISEIKTLWGESLVNFHHRLFFENYPNIDIEKHIFDNSEWFHEVGGTTYFYYVALLMLAVKYGILFDNFMLNNKEITFTKDVFLPAFIHVYELTGVKPLIVPLEPIETEGDEFWLSYTQNELLSIKKLL